MALGVTMPSLPKPASGGGSGTWQTNRLYGGTTPRPPQPWDSANSFEERDQARGQGVPYVPSPLKPVSNGGLLPDPNVDAFNQWLASQQALGQSSYLNQIGYNDATYQNNLGAATTNADIAKQLLGLDQYRQVDLGKQRNAANAGFVNRGFGIDMRKAELSRDINKRGAESDAAARGAFSSQGFDQNIADIYQQFYNSRDTAVLSRDKQLSDIAFDNKALDALASEYGLRAKDIDNKLQQSITQMGLDYNQTVNQLNQQLTSGNLALEQQALNFMIQMMAMPGAGTQVLPGAGGTPPAPTPQYGGGGGRPVQRY